MTIPELQKKANEVRKGIITGTHAAKSGHPGGSLSAADVFIYLYFKEMNIDPEDEKNPDRDRFIIKRPHSTRFICSTGTERIFPSRRFNNTPPHRFPSSGSSMYAAHTRT